MFVKDMDKQV